MAFGSTSVGNGYRAWTRHDRLTTQLVAVALAIFCFDAFVNNVDRRDNNPNCLFRTPQLYIFDHELTFLYKGIVGWKHPWTPGALAPLTVSGCHIFHAKLKGQNVDVGPIREAWSALSDARLAAYRNSIPLAWGNVGEAVDDAICLIQGVRNNIGSALA
ncbi:MAG: hypothetical protein HC767_09065, partial [Akkermansiaceae bacterium]|nr:hypothetical protein [Akkermansiaceae bacterium]